MKTRLEQLESFLTDARAYLTYCAKHEISHDQQLLTLVHDICGLQREEKCFRPRVSGYSEIQEADSSFWTTKTP